MSLLCVLYAVRWLLVGRRRLVVLCLLVLIRLLLRLVRLVVSEPPYGLAIGVAGLFVCR